MVGYLGLSNTAGVLAEVFGTAATGYILQKGKKTQKLKLFFFYTAQQSCCSVLYVIVLSQ